MAFLGDEYGVYRTSISNHASTLLLCLVLMWLVFNWREAVASTNVLNTMLDMSDNWRDVTDRCYQRNHELVKDLFETTDRLRLKENRLHEEPVKLRRENEEVNDWNQRQANEKDDVMQELYQLRKALWIEKNGPLGDDVVLF